ncbi:MAG: polyprenol monophosphomannose synthase [Candidatus Competibacteraceae bacterium]|nr:polyprenol monophosphomannose synthase [Candidatus Competibacteraceae bacterium]
MNVAIIIPTYNEVDNIALLVRRIAEVLPGVHVLIVDDASPDGTADLAESLANNADLDLRILRRAGKTGLGSAYTDGFTHALALWPEAEVICQMDADLSHDPAYLPAMIAALEHADLVIGSRYVDGISIVNWPLDRLIVKLTCTAYARLTTGLPVTDCTSGFKCFRAPVLRQMDLKTIRASGYAFQIETSFRAWRAGRVLVDYPIIFYERRHGESKLDLSIAMEACFTGLRLLCVRLSDRAAKAFGRRAAHGARGK